MRGTLGVLIASALAASLGAAPLGAQEYPSRTIRVIVPLTPGGGVDTVARTVAQKISENVGQPVIIDNRPGAGHNVGIDATAKSAPDGYTVLMSSSTIAINPALYKTLSYNPLTDFSPISMTSVVGLILVTSPKLPVKSVAELVALSRKSKEPLTYASAGQGGSTHLAVELMLMLAGTKMTHIPYTSTANKNADVVSGRVDIMFTAPPSVASFIQTNRLRPLAMSGAKRSQLFPDLPTVAEAGVPGYDYASWNAMFGPAKIPRPIVNRLNSEVIKAINSPEIRDRLLKIGAEPETSTPEELGAYVKTEIAKYTKLVAATGITPE